MKKYKRWSLLCLFAMLLGCFTGMAQENMDTAESEALDIEMAQTIVNEPYELEAQLGQLAEDYTDRYIVKYKGDMGGGEKISLQESAAVAFETAKEAKIEKIASLEEEKLPQKAVASLSAVEEADVELERIQLQKGELMKSAGLGSAALIEGPVTPAKTEYEILTLDEKVDPEVFLPKLLEDAGDLVEYIQPDYQLELASLPEVEQAIPVASPSSQPEEVEIELEVIPVPTSGDEKALPTPEEVSPTPTPEEEISTSVPEEWESGSAIGQNETPVQEVIVAILDTGIDVTHPDLEGRFVDGYDFCNRDDSVYDEALDMEQAHGTHIAGIIAANAPQAKLMPLKVFENGRAYTSDLIAAIEYAENNGAAIANCSWGATDNNRALREAMEESSLFFVCAAGNNRLSLDETAIYPACYGLPNSISVTAVNADYGFSYFSNYSTSKVDLAAFGRDIESTLPGGERGKISGTSMAAGFVSAAAALAASLGETDLKGRLKNTADRLSNLQNKVDGGRFLNAAQVVSNTSSEEIIETNPADDFDVHGYQPTPEESWELFCGLDNVKIAGGVGCILVLKENGTVWIWGSHYYSILGTGLIGPSAVPRQVIGAEGMVDIGASYKSFMAIKEDGTAYSWGRIFNTSSLTATQIEGITDAKAVAEGDGTTFIKKDGTVWNWGDNLYGQLGDGTNTTRTYPVQVEGLTDVVKVTVDPDNRFKLALKSDGTIWAWGKNSAGQLGDGTTIDKNIPVQVQGIDSVVDIACSLDRSLALRSDGTVWMWGKHYSFDGPESPESSSLPIQKGNLTNVIDIGAGYSHSLALCEDGTVKAWGENGGGQLGNGDSLPNYTLTSVLRLVDVKQICVAATLNIALKEDGSIWIWGTDGVANYPGYVGISARIDPYTPTQIQSLDGVLDFDACNGRALAVKSDKTVWEWGTMAYLLSNEYDAENFASPRMVRGLSEVKQVSIGDYSNWVLKEDGTVWGWGVDPTYENGYLDPSVLRQVDNLNNIEEIAAGKYHVIALDTTGAVWAWGGDYPGYPVPIEGIPNVRAVYAGNDVSYAIDEDDNLWAWGNNRNGQYGDGTWDSSDVPKKITTISNVKEIAICENYVLAIKNDGTLWYWGYLPTGLDETDSDTPKQISALNDVVSVACGMEYALAVKENGTVYTRGNNDHGEGGSEEMSFEFHQFPNVTGVSKVYTMRAYSTDFENTTYMIKSDNTIWSCGYNGNGELGQGLAYQSPYPITPLYNNARDQESNTWDDAHEIGENALFRGAIDFEDDVDWLTFTPSSAGTYTISVQASETVATKVFTDSGAESGSALKTMSGTAASTSVSVTAGSSYYIQLSGSVTPYSVYVSKSQPIKKAENEKLYTALKRARPQLDTNHDGTIEPLELQTLTGMLDLSSSGLTDISGLQSCINVTSLYVDHNQLVDISAVTNMVSLKQLYASHNEIVEMGGIHANSSLQVLDLSHNKITEISYIGSMPKLEYLYLGHNTIFSIPGIASITQLKCLDLSYNVLEDIAPLASLTQLKYLNLSNNLIERIDPLSQMSALSELRLSHNKIAYLEPLPQAEYTFLWLDYNLVDLSVYEELLDGLSVYNLCIYPQN